MDVLGIREDGYHEVATVMQQISLCDDIDIEWFDTEENMRILAEEEKRNDFI